MENTSSTREIPFANDLRTLIKEFELIPDTLSDKAPKSFKLSSGPGYEILPAIKSLAGSLTVPEIAVLLFADHEFFEDWNESQKRLLLDIAAQNEFNRYERFTQKRELLMAYFETDESHMPTFDKYVERIPELQAQLRERITPTPSPERR